MSAAEDINLNPERPNIYKYHDYREYFRDLFKSFDSNFKGFSIRKLCMESGVAPSLITMILSEGQTLTEKTLFKLLPQLNMQPEESKFLGLLIRLSDSERQEDREKAYSEMRQVAKYLEANPEEVVVHEYLNSWLYPAIREMAQMSEFKFDPWWVKTQLKMKVTIAEIRDALYFLLRNKFLEMDEQGKVKKPDRAIMCQAGIYRLSIAEYHKQTLKLAGEAPHNSKRSERKMSGHTIAIAQDNFEKVRAILSEAEAKIIALTEQQTNATHVYQVSLVAFPLTGSETTGRQNE